MQWYAVHPTLPGHPGDHLNLPCCQQTPVATMKAPQESSNNESSMESSNNVSTTVVDRSIHLRDLNSGDEIRTLSGHDGKGPCLCKWVPQNPGYPLGPANIDDQCPVLGHTDRVNAVAIFGDILVSASADKTLRRWSTTQSLEPNRTELNCTELK